MKKGCEIEARGITYKIYTKNRENPFKIFTKETQEANKNQEETSHARGVVVKRHVLKDVHFKAKPWEILAIVGPSGAGKSTLLETLAGKLTPQSGSVLVNQCPVNKAELNKISGYVTQRDTLFPLLTVEETLMFSARLRLKLPQDQLVSRVKSLIKELGLEHVSMTRVGDEYRVRGISGGERRRVSIGVDVIHDPEVLILDEPTSGLDSTSALQIVDMLNVMADVRGRTVILSIHQPGYRIVKLFGSVLLMADGSVLHHGSVDQLCINMMSMGLQLPLHANVVEFAIESIETIQQVVMQPQEAEKQLNKKAEDGKSRSGKFTLQQLFQQSKVVDEENMDTSLLNSIYLSHDFANFLFYC